MDAPFPTTDSRMYVTLHRQPADVQHLLGSGKASRLYQELVVRELVD